MPTIDENGFTLKTQNEYFQEEIELYRDIDPEWNLDPSTPDGLKAARDAEVFSLLDVALLLAYNSKDPAQARDLDLDRICAITGVRRSPGTPSQVALTLRGVDGTEVTSGSRVESMDGTRWSIDHTVTIAAGEAAVTATALTVGRIEIEPNEQFRILTVTGGWQAAESSEAATPGTDRQSNPSLRRERALTVGRPSQGQLDSILGEVFAVAGVRFAVAQDNLTTDIDANGVPPGATYVIVDGGADDEIALAIYLKYSAGSPLYAAGTPVTVNVQSPRYAHQSTTITFSRPIYVDQVIHIIINNDGSLPPTASEDIEAAILEYVQPNSLRDGFNTAGFRIGDDVVIGRFYTPINKIIGQYGNSFVQSIVLNGSSENQKIAFNELARFSSANIIVSII